MENHDDMPPLEEAETLQPSRGAGGKVRKQFNRRSRTTPYSRPQTNLSQAPIADGDGGGWISKLVTPARRLIASGAARILPFFWSPAVESSALSSDEDHETEQDEVQHLGEDETGRESSDVAFSLSHQIPLPHATIVEHGSSSNAAPDGPKVGEARGMPDSDGLVEIEKMIRGKSFSRDEVERLMAILNLKNKDSAKLDGQKLQSIMMGEEVQRSAMKPVFSNKAKEEDQGRFDRDRQEILTPLPKSNLWGDIGASPIDIARAYMGSRMSDIGSSSMSGAFEDDKAMVHIPLPSRKPSTCWPGAMVRNQLLTPQSLRGRYDFHTFHRTPYSRSVNSMSKLKLTQLRDDGSNSLNITSTPLQQPSTTIGGQVKSSTKASDSHYGSGGPIRRARHQLAAGSPRKFVSFSRLPSSVQREKTDVGIHSLPTFRRNADAVGTNTSKPLSVEDKPQRTSNVPTHSSQMAKQILEHLDRTVATPKDWSAELNLATLVKNPKPSSDVISIGDAPDSQVAADKRNHTTVGAAADNVKGKSIASDAGFAYTARTDAAKPYENVSKLAPASSSNSQFQHLLKKPPTQIPIQKSVLPPLRSTTLPSDNTSWGFTFPVSASPGAFPEPPTPSVMLPPSLLNTQNGDSEIPSFSFGSKSPSPLLVFSFPSTAILNDASSDIKFSFGSDKARIDVGSIGKDAVCC